MKLSRFAAYAWSVVVYNLAVIVWGAYVRASGSGAGCGDHWPLCNGEVIPRAPAIETLVEFIHRITSGLALVSVIGLIIWAFRIYPRSHIVRRGATFSLIFMVAEALLGAGLVLFELVAHNESVARVFSMSAHLINTFLLVAAMTLTAAWASGLPRPRLHGQGQIVAAIYFGLGLAVLIGVTGAVIALGDTLFFAYLANGGSETTLSPLVSALKQIRIVHPMVAVLASIYLGVLGWQVARLRPNPAAIPLAWTLTILIGIQMIVGVLNVYLKVPIAIQLIHLLLADLIWMSTVLICANTVAEREGITETSPAATRLRGSPVGP